MKKLLTSVLFLLGFLGSSYGQDYCENFKIVSILDFPPSPTTPGGNFFLLLLTVDEDNEDNFGFYADLFFTDQFGDTISIPTGPSSSLPIYASDTIPYLLELNSADANQDFPEEFNGQLVIIHSIQPVCEVGFSNSISNIDSTENGVELGVYPNPCVDLIHIESKIALKAIRIFNTLGTEVLSSEPLTNSSVVHIESLVSGSYFLVITLVNREVVFRKLLKS